jgi:hypothetical protein
LVLLGHRPLPESAGVPEDLRAEARALRGQIRRLLADLAASHGSRSEEIRNQLSSLGSRYEELLIRMRFSHPGYEDLVGVTPASPEEIQAALGEDAALVSYFLLDEGVLAWILDRRQMLGLAIPVKREAVETAVGQMRQAIASRGDPSAHPLSPPERGVSLLAAPAKGPPAEEDLYRLLISPLLPHLRHRSLILVPHGALHYLPFAALRNPATGRFLVEDHILSYAPSASAVPLLAVRSRSRRGDALILGDPLLPAEFGLAPLQGAREEAETVGRLLQVEPLLGPAATEERLRERAGDAGLIHIAAHGVMSAEAALFTYVALAPGTEQDGRLEVTEVFEELNLSGVSTVVLSGCETALGERTRGDEVVGLIRSVLHAGAATVVASLWSIEDRASSLLMEAFYRRLAAGASPAEALREAQLELLRSAEHAAPYYWAAFTLTGAPR